MGEVGDRHGAEDLEVHRRAVLARGVRQAVAVGERAAVALVADDLGITVLCYGLRTDFLGQLFAGSAALLAIADKLVELKAICECGRKATMNLRVDEAGRAVRDGEQTQIGGNDSYIALCRKHFMARLKEGDI